jgi:DNA-binding transcriptional regulator YdaS (Cro superfamily)
MSQHNLQNPFVIKAIATCAGSQTELARRCGGRVKQGHIWRWLHTPKLTAEACAALECGSGGVVTKAQMRPDLFGDAGLAGQQEAA